MEQVDNIIVYKDITDLSTLKSKFLQLSNNKNFALITTSETKNDTVLISGLSIKDVQAYSTSTFILTTDGIVYLVPQKTTFQQQTFSDENSSFWKGIDFNQDICCFEFTKKDPIESIYAKFGQTFAFINKNGEVYLNCSDPKYCGKLKQNLFENKKIIKVVSGVEHILFLTSDGFVYSLGTGFDGKLGHGKSIKYNSSFEYIFGKCDLKNIFENNNSKAIDIAASYNTSFILTDKGQVYSCGDHTYGANAQPLDFIVIPNEFQLVENKKIVKEMMIGYFFGAFKTVEDDYQVFGLNNFYQFSNNFTNDKIMGVTDFNLNKSKIKQQDIYQLDCGGYGSIIVTKNGKIYSSGSFSCSFVGKNNNNYEITEHSDVISMFVKDLKSFKVSSGVTTVVYFTINQKEIIDIFNFKNIWKISDCNINTNFN
ncbi:hypothetical protein ABK040_004029 [Willaertia magna]